MRTRAWRRHQQYRAFVNAKNFLRYVWHHEDEDTLDKAAHTRAKTRKTCSCLGCGNRRQYDGPSIAELRHQQDLEV